MKTGKKQFYADRKVDIEPFCSAEEAWFWYCRVQGLRDMGARFEKDASKKERPCDADDIYRVVKALFYKGQLKKSHIEIMFKFGFMFMPPDERDDFQRKESSLWKESMETIKKALKIKGIVL